ncbi:fungal-specific transcription factor domain-containing protein [Aspergillus insuetus]
MPEIVWDLRQEQRDKSASCWTCRERHIKCDERPGACRICEQAKLVCAGYEVRLIWNASARNTSSRRRIQGGRVSCASMTDAEIARALTAIEKCTTGQTTTITVGPFSVFWSEAPSSPLADCLFSTPTNSWEDDSFDQLMHGCHSAAGESPVSLPKADILEDGAFVSAPLQAPTPESQQSLSPCAIERGHGNDAHQLLLLSSSPHPDSHHTSPPSQAISTTISQSVDAVALTPDEPPSESVGSILAQHELSFSVLESTTTTMLIHHYMQHVVHLMQPVSHPRNPFSTVYLPLALQCSRASRDAHDDLQPASVAVFHSLLSTAATNLQSNGIEHRGLKRLAYHHKQRALAALQRALADRTTPYRDLMIGILSLVSVDIMDGGMSDHWIHLEAGTELQASRHYAMLLSHETCLLNSICRILHLFGQTTLPHMHPKRWPGYDELPRGADLYFLEPSIEFLYGITTSIAGAIFKIYRLAQYLAYYRAGGEQYPASLLRACEMLADELCSYTINSESFSAIGREEEQGGGSRMVAIARAQAKAFYHTALIYYYRSIQQCARSYLHREQQAVLAAMNEAEDLKFSRGWEMGPSLFPAPITWPAFVASCEAVGGDRELWREWWGRVQRYGMRNYRQQFSTVCSIWGKLDNDETTDWREALAEMGLRILPV